MPERQNQTGKPQKKKKKRETVSGFRFLFKHSTLRFTNVTFLLVFAHTLPGPKGGGRGGGGGVLFFTFRLCHASTLASVSLIVWLSVAMVSLLEAPVVRSISVSYAHISGR